MDRTIKGPYDDKVLRYTDVDMARRCAAVRRYALQEAARVCDKLNDGYDSAATGGGGWMYTGNCEDAIRALIDAEPER